MIKDIPKERLTTFEPASSEALLKIEKRFNIIWPKDHREVLLQTDGFSLISEYYNLILAHVKAIHKLNLDDWYKEALPNMFIIGDDESETLYFYDVQDCLNKGAYSVYAVPKDALFLENSVWVAKSLTELIYRLINNEKIV